MINREGKVGNGKNDKLIKKLLSEDDHSGTDLSGTQLFNINLSKKDFSNCDFESAKLTGSDLSHCDLSNVNLDDADMRGTHLFNCILDGAKRGGKQVLKFASIINGEKSHYAFLCTDGKSEFVLINEQGNPEREFKMGSATDIGRVLYNLLFND
jgi:hypothetical protein